MNILHLIPDIKLGCGLSNSVFTASQAMNMKGHKIFVTSEFIDDYYREKFSALGIDWYYSPLLQTRKNPLSLYRNYKTIKSKIAGLNIDIVHSHHRWNAVIARLATRNLSCHITSDHNVLYGNKWLSFQADKIITDSHFNKQHLMSYFKVPEEKIIIVPPLIEHTRFQELRELDTQDTEDKFLDQVIDPKNINIGQIARLSEQKGQSFLIDAVEKIHQKNKRLRFYILGDGPLKYELNQKIKNKNLQNIITILPLMKDVKPFLARMNFMVYSSRHEGFCAAVSESLLAGRPVIGTTTGGIPEQVIDGENGYLYNFGDAAKLMNLCLTLAKDDALIAKMSQNARNIFLSKYGHAVVSEKLEKAYNNGLTHYRDIGKN